MSLPHPNPKNKKKKEKRREEEELGPETDHYWLFT